MVVLSNAKDINPSIKMLRPSTVAVPTVTVPKQFTAGVNPVVPNPVAQPAPLIGTMPPIQRITVPGQRITVPTPQVTVPTPQVTVPRPQVTVPTPQVTVPTPQVTVPTPQVTVPRPQVTVPTPQVTVPTPQVTVPTPQVTVPTPQVTVPRPQVTVPRPQVTVPTPQVTVPTPQVTVPAPQMPDAQAVTPKMATQGGGVLKQFGGGTAVVTVGAIPQVTAAPTVKIVEETGHTILTRSLGIWNGTPEQARELSMLVYGDGTSIIDIKRRDIMVEIIGMLKNQGFEEVVKFLTGAPNPDYVLWAQKSLDEGRIKVAREAVIQQAEEVGVKGVGKCRYCNSTELVFSQRQLRSGDEPATIFVRCVLCTKQWRQ
jgi:hypothetical protein